MSSSKKTTTVEVLKEGDTVFGHSNMAGKYWVREYRDGQETGGAFFSSKGDADKHIKEYLVEGENDEQQYTKTPTHSMVGCSK